MASYDRSLYGGIDSSDVQTVADLENLKNGLRPGRNRGDGYSSLIRTREIQLEEAKLRLNQLNNQRQTGYERNRRRGNLKDQYAFDDNAFVNSESYRLADRQYKAAKDALAEVKRNSKQQSDAYKLLAAKFEADGTANMIRSRAKEQAGQGQLKRISGEVDYYNAQIKQRQSSIDNINKHLKGAKNPIAIGIAKAEADRYQKDIEDFKSKANEGTSKIRQINNKIAEIDGKSLIKKADNNARARKANKKAPKLTRKRRK